MGAIDTTNTFTATDVITSAKMNNILDQSLMTATAIIGDTLAVTSGKLFVKAGGITSNEIGSNAVTTTAILDANVTPAKLSNSDFGDFIVASGVATIDANAITTVKILDANVTPAKLSQPSTLATLQTATGTSVDFTGIPSWAKRATIMFSGVSTNGTSSVLIRLGAGGIATTGYLTASSVIAGGATDVQNNTTGFRVYYGSSDSISAVRSGSLIINLIGSNTWAAQGAFSLSNDNSIGIIAGSISLSGALDTIRITTIIGSQSFDAGSINVSYE
mgnify:CR=1 FL=1